MKRINSTLFVLLILCVSIQALAEIDLPDYTKQVEESAKNAQPKYVAPNVSRWEIEIGATLAHMNYVFENDLSMAYEAKGWMLGTRYHPYKYISLAAQIFGGQISDQINSYLDTMGGSLGVELIPVQLRLKDEASLEMAVQGGVINLPGYSPSLNAGEYFFDVSIVHTSQAFYGGLARVRLNRQFSLLGELKVLEDKNQILTIAAAYNF